ncbi:hypothetical protein ABZV14_05865 [Streptosporangium canum]|uniref:hypothetical protein n=1 Tax=Streptosporangium canum TaxID=324952 RepID=UPI0033A1FFC1
MTHEELLRRTAVRALAVSSTLADCLVFGADWDSELRRAEGQQTADDDRAAWDRCKEVTRLFARVKDEVDRRTMTPEEAFIAINNHKDQFGPDSEAGPIELTVTAHLGKLLAMTHYILAGTAEWEKRVV